MRLSIQTKLFILIAGLTTVILAGLVVALTATVSARIREQVEQDFENTRSVFRTQQALTYDRLIETTFVLGRNPTFTSNVVLEHPQSVYFSLEEFAQDIRADLFVVTDADGFVLARLGEPENYDDDITHRRGVADALEGFDPDPENPELWAVDGRLYLVATAPLYVPELVGTVSIGREYTQFEARELKGSTNIDITLFYEDQVIATTYEQPLDTDEVQQFYTTRWEQLQNLHDESVAGESFEMRLNGEQVLAFVSRLGTGEPGYYLAAVALEDELVLLRRLQRTGAIIAAISILVAVFMALVLGRTFSRPILRLVSGMNKVKMGDLDISVPPTTRDEIGLLTTTFNEMIGGLRERLHLRKYVGKLTIDMITDAATDEVNLGGERRELAVLFSDVRGFTAYSENRTPEEVIGQLNRYLGFQAEIVSELGGSVDKFVGDEMMALFSGEQAVEQALQCAVVIQERVRKEQESDPQPFGIGIGINYGPMVLGNIGASNRLDYTVIGSAVNLGARLCSEAKAGGVLIPKEIVDNVHLRVRGRRHAMSFKGFSSAIEVVEVVEVHRNGDGGDDSNGPAATASPTATATGAASGVRGVS